jgi:hypothetical protein
MVLVVFPQMRAEMMKGSRTSGTPQAQATESPFESDLYQSVDAFFVPIDASGVDLPEHVLAVSYPLGDLGSWHARVEPGGDGGVSEVVRTLRKR